MAAEEGHAEVVNTLLLQASSIASELVNLTEEKNVTALMRASQNGFELAARILLDHKADVDVQRDDTRRTALVLASRNGHVASSARYSTFRPNRHQRQGWPHSDSQRRQVWPCAVIEVLIDDSHSPWGTLITPWRSSRGAVGHDAAVRTLLQHGAHMDRPDDRGRTPMLWRASMAMRHRTHVA